MFEKYVKMAVVKPKTIVITTIPNKRPISFGQTFDLQSETQIEFMDEEEELFHESGPRKRKRLTHLSPDQRMMRRKLKNRVAAQTARDRKKVRMEELEEAVVALEAENKRLQNENSNLKQKTGYLCKENNNLREKLCGIEDKTGDESKSKELVPPESAAGNGTSCFPGIAVHNLHPNSQPDLMGLLQQIVESSQSNEHDNTTIVPSTACSSATNNTTTKVVGPTTAELESIKELIQFDHEYFKSESPTSSVQQQSQKSVSNGPETKKLTKSMVSIVAPQTVKNTKATCTVTVSVQDPLDHELVKSEPMESIETVNVSELDLSTLLSKESLDTLLDLELLLVEKDKVDSDEVVITIDSEDNTAPSTIQNDIATSSFCDSSETNPFCLEPAELYPREDMCSLKLSSPEQQVTTKLSPRWSESGYGSDIGSPQSQFSLFNEPEPSSLHDIWEESFTELFPSLA